MKNFLRWTLFIPLAGAASQLSLVAFFYISRLTMSRFDADPDGLFGLLVGGIIMGIVFVVVGNAVAPGGKTWVPWLLSAVVTCILGIVVQHAVQAGRWLDLASTVLMTIASFVTARYLTQALPKEEVNVQASDEERPPGRVERQPDGTWVRLKSSYTGTMHRIDLEPIEKRGGEWVPAQQKSAINDDPEAEIGQGPTPTPPPSKR